MTLAVVVLYDLNYPFVWKHSKAMECEQITVISAFRLLNVLTSSKYNFALFVVHPYAPNFRVNPVKQHLHFGYPVDWSLMVVPTAGILIELSRLFTYGVVELKL